MSELFAIRGPRHRTAAASRSATSADAAAPSPADGDQGDPPLARLLKMIPGEAVTFYGTSASSLAQLRHLNAIPDQTTYFAALVVVTIMAIVLLVVIRWRMTKDPKTGETQWQPVLIAVISFLIYAYTMGGPFQYFPTKVGPGWLGALGFSAASFWTLITPYLFTAAAD